jgi:putative transcriptional regulator
VFVLRWDRDTTLPRTVDAMTTLARRGLTLLKAKRAIEALVEDGRVFVDLPTVEDHEILRTELDRAGIVAAHVEPAKPLDVRGLRERLGLTREQFAIRYGMEIETLRNWETGKRPPDTTALSYLRAISNDPEPVERAYAPTRPSRSLPS